MDHPAPKPPEVSLPNATVKEQLRRDYLAKRSLLPQAVLSTLSQALVLSLAHWLQAQQTRQVLLFYPVQGEVDLRGLADLLPGVTLALPVLATRGKGMTFAQWTAESPMVVNHYGIPEPRTDRGATLVSIVPRSVILVPCLALDTYGTRLGYGGGFYDRFLATHASELVTVGTLLSEFMHTGLPREAHDISLQYGATELGVQPLKPL